MTNICDIVDLFLHTERNINYYRPFPELENID